MKTIKIKLPFNSENSIIERKNALNKWAKAMLKQEILIVIEEEHYETMSYIVIVNTFAYEKIHVETVSIY